jgi:hypothetical protein
MRKCFCLLNHVLTQKQLAELLQKYNVSNIEYPPSAISDFWRQIPTTAQILKSYLQSITEWLKLAEQGDLIIIQGEFGSTFALVDWALSKKIIPVYAVTKRVETEEKQGETVTRHYVFEHECFREYKKYTDLV